METFDKMGFLLVISWSSSPWFCRSVVCECAKIHKFLLALELISEARSNPVGHIQGSFPVVGWNLSSHVPVKNNLISNHIKFSNSSFYGTDK